MAYATVNPYTNELVRSFETATAEEVEAAIDHAHAAFLTWRETPHPDRAAVLAKAAGILRDRRTEFAKILTLEMGKVIGEAEAEVDLSADILQWYADRAEALLQPRPLEVADPAEGVATIVPQPLGVLYAVEPWNFPYYQVARVVGPQLSVGNTIILKHAGIVPQAAEAFESLLREAGLPDGAFINLFASHDATEQILADPRVRGVALTGSEAAGASIAAEAAKNLKKSTLELGGADAFIVLEDADIDKTVEWAVTGRHWNAGQVCTSSKRLIVVDAVYDEFLEKYRAGVAALKAGDPLDRSTTLAPLSSQDAADRLAEQVKEAVAHGASAEQLGDPVPTRGAFFQPTILTGVDAENPAFHEELFGPVSLIFRVADEDEAIAIANDSPFGLGGSVFTRDEERGRAVAEKMDTGMVYVNHPTMVKADIPFGGVKRSGYGHELTDLGLFEFVNQKVIDVVDIDAPF